MSNPVTQQIFYPFEEGVEDQTLIDMRSPELLPPPPVNVPMRDFSWRFTTPWDNLTDEEIKEACGCKVVKKPAIVRCIEVLQAGDYYIPEPVCLLEEEMAAIEAAWTDPRNIPVALSYSGALLAYKTVTQQLENK